MLNGYSNIVSKHKIGNLRKDHNRQVALWLCKCLSRVADGNLLMILSSLQVSGEDCILGTPLTGETGKLLLVIGRSICCLLIE